MERLFNTWKKTVKWSRNVYSITESFETTSIIRIKVAAILYPSWCLWKNVFPRYSRLGSRSLKSSRSLDHAMEPNNCCNKNSLHKAGCLIHLWRLKSETPMLIRVDEQNERENTLRASSKHKRKLAFTLQFPNLNYSHHVQNTSLMDLWGIKREGCYWRLRVWLDVR